MDIKKKSSYHQIVERFKESTEKAGMFEWAHALLSFLFSVVEADGKIDDAEMEEFFALRSTLLSHLDDNDINMLVEDIMDRGNVDSLEKIAEVFPDLSARIRLYEIAYSICLVDNNVHKLEKKLLKKIRQKFDLSTEITDELHEELKREYWGDRK